MLRAIVLGTLVVALLVAVPYANGQVGSTSKTGSLLIFPKIELKFDPATGDLVQDTFIDIANNENQDVMVLAYFVSEECNWIAVNFDLTHDEPAYWSAATGQPKLGIPWTLLGSPYPDPSGGPYDVMRGYIVLFAINPDHQQIAWNHLKGEATIINYAEGNAWEYNAWAFEANCDQGRVCGPAGNIQLGVNYDWAPAQLLLDFIATGSTAYSGDGVVVTHDTDLTLLIADQDLRQDFDCSWPYITKAQFYIWNENEVSIGGYWFCLIKWNQDLLSNFAGPFLVENLGTNKGRALIDGVLSNQCCEERTCPPNPPQWFCAEARPLLGVQAKILEFDTGPIAVAGSNLIGVDVEATDILFDIVPGPFEFRIEPDDVAPGSSRGIGL